MVIQNVDATLKGRSALSLRYEKKGEVSRGAQAGSSQLVHRHSGVPYVLREFHEESLSSWKRAEIEAAVEANRRLTDHSPDTPEVASARIAPIYEVFELVELLTSRRPASTSAQGVPAAASKEFRSLLLVSESAGQGTDLLSLVEQRGRLPENEARVIFANIVLAVKSAHDRGVLLRNIKPEVVQVHDKPGGGRSICLAEMHCAAKLKEGSEESCLTGLHGTPEYAAPEVVIWFWQETDPPQLPEPPPEYGLKADSWALGMCLHVMLCGCFPFDANQDLPDMLRSINEADFSYNDPGWKELSESALDLVRMLLERDPEQRPFLEEVLQHPFCSENVLQAIEASGDGGTATLRMSELDEALDALDSDGED